ncbi:uracil phosphoribosyltransferase [Novosphingobium sp. G106]|uniref:uracil phosphoribosyltransferase n=1 Tax=Novosphingobium sp. G106 TaxID=2849500 RepID=UPI001C2DCBB2|nr:uracil phosphoribosyltransferase [Novosphingobium sp. G106]MBV1686407.1 uracil phosphoribosyltransferase [Novosphingobium sp. G106]
MAGRLRLIDHNLALHKLSHMRDRECAPNRFRRLMRQASLILCSEMTRDLDLAAKEIVTANGVRTTGYVRDQSDLVIMPVLRAGLVMGEAFSELLPMARTGHIGIYRTSNNEHHCYMLSIPRTSSGTKFLIVDPVISQGETAALAVRSLVRKGFKGENVRVGCLIVSEPGRENFYGNPQNKGITDDVDIFAIAEDPQLDDNLYVLPGLGNASERMFRTNESRSEQEEFE